MSAPDRKNRLLILLCGVFAVLLVVSLAESIWAVSLLHKAQTTAREAIYTAKEAQMIAEYYMTQDSIKEAEPDPVLEPLSVEEEPEPEYTTMTVTATAYCSCVKCCGIWSESHPSRIGTDYIQHTSSGTIPTANRTIATDPDVIPEGSKVELNGIMYVAEDTGSAVTGAHIDIYMNTHEEAAAWGSQTVEVRVYENKTH